MKPVVVLVHGIFDKGSIFKSLASHLENLGFETVCPDLIPNDGSESLMVLAGHVRDHVEHVVRTNRRVFLVGFSMGGLICRYFMQVLGGVEKVERWVTISAPHNGTWTASLFWGRGVEEMRRESTFLRKLNASADAVQHVPFMSLWTPYDLMILPATSSVLPFGENISVDCMAHPLMNSNKEVIRRVGDFLTSHSLD